MTADEKRTAYAALRSSVAGLVKPPGDAVAMMANVAAVLHHALPYSSWTGFYRVVEEGLLRVGPFQGPVACVDIPFDRGVCGAAARSGQTHVVADVHAFPGHVACDPAARSEIVVPLRDAGGRVFAVLDVDSHQPAAFDDVDRQGLEALVEHIAPHLSAA
jgi:L-methionine (R)-S-oxide reductase